MTEKSLIRVMKTRQIIFAGLGYALPSLKGNSTMKQGKSMFVPACTTDSLPFTMPFSYIMYQADQRDTLKTH